MTSTQTRPPLNGVDTPTLFATLDAVKGSPDLAKFQFRATNRWISGTHNRSTIRGFYGAGQEDSSRTEDFTYDASASAQPSTSSRISGSRTPANSMVS